MAKKAPREHFNNVVKVRVGVFEYIEWGGRGGVLGNIVVGLSPDHHVDLKDSPCGEVCSVSHARVQLFRRVETCLEHGNDQLEWRVVVGVAIEPSDGARKTYGGVNGFGISDIPEDPADAAHIVYILLPNAL